MIKYEDDVLLTLLDPDNSGKKVNFKLKTFLSFLINDCNIIRNVAVENITPDYIIETINNNYEVEMSKKDIITSITQLIKLDYISQHIHEDCFSIVLTKHFYEYFIDNFEVEEEYLPDDYENINSVIKHVVDSLDTVIVNEDKTVSFTSIMLNTDTINKQKEIEKKKNKELNDYTCSLIHQIFNNNK